MEYSLFMIKPMAYEHKREILDFISKELKIESTRDVLLSKDFLNKLYKNENDKFKRINTLYLAGKMACIGVVSGENAKTKLVEICGEHFIPEKCNPNSIRYKYRNNKVAKIDGEIFYVNAIHKSTPEEADEEVKLYIDEFIKPRNREREDEER